MWPEALLAFVLLVDITVTVLLQMEISHMANTVETLRTAVEKLTTVRESATALISGLVDEVKQLRTELAGQGVDTTAIDNLVARVEAETAALASAVAFGTAAEGEGDLQGSVSEPPVE